MDLPAAGPLTGSEPIETVQVVGGVPTSVQTTASAIGAARAPSYVDIGSSHAYTLANGTVDGQRVGICDNLLVASNATPIVITGNLVIGGAINISFPGGSYEFVWNASQGKWRVF